MAKTLSIDNVGSPFDGKINNGVIYRMKKVPETSAKFPYLTISHNIERSADIVVVSDFRAAKEKLKRHLKKGTGLEVTIAPARKMDAAGIGKWFENVSEMHSFCEASGCQLILSSGATAINEMISGPCLDAIIKNCDIDPHEYWYEMNNWLEAKLARRILV